MRFKRFSKAVAFLLLSFAVLQTGLIADTSSTSETAQSIRVQLDKIKEQQTDILKNQEAILAKLDEVKIWARRG